MTLGTSVLTPSFRYNPAIVAQAFATLGCLAPDRVILGRRDRRVDERGPGRHRLAGAERAVRPAQGVGHADPDALPRGVRHVRGRVLPDPRRHDLRPAGDSRSRSTSPPPGRPRRGWPGGSADGLICTSGKGAGALHRDAPASGRRGRRQGRPRRGAAWAA